MRNTYKILDGNRKGERHRRRWESNIIMELMETGLENMGWFHLSQDSVRWRALVESAMNLRVNFLSSQVCKFFHPPQNYECLQFWNDYDTG
jgi:hypothetical protein